MRPAFWALRFSFPLRLPLLLLCCRLHLQSLQLQLLLQRLESTCLSCIPDGSPCCSAAEGQRGDDHKDNDICLAADLQSRETQVASSRPAAETRGHSRCPGFRWRPGGPKSFTGPLALYSGCGTLTDSTTLRPNHQHPKRKQNPRCKDRRKATD